MIACSYADPPCEVTLTLMISSSLGTACESAVYSLPSLTYIKIEETLKAGEVSPFDFAASRWDSLFGRSVVAVTGGLS